MRADDAKFNERLYTLDVDGLRTLASEEHRLRVEAELREEANQRISTEMHIQFKELSGSYDDMKKELDDLKKLYQHEIEKNVLLTRSTFGRNTEKFLDLVKSADDKEDGYEDEDQEEDTGGGNGKGRIINFPNKGGTGGKKGQDSPGTGRRKSRLKASLEDLPHEIIYDICIDMLNAEFGEGNWRIAYWHRHELLEKMPVQYYVRDIYTPVISVGLEHMLFTTPYTGALMPHAYVSPSLLADIIYRKFVLGLPFYRQAVDMQMSNVALLKQTIIHWVNTVTPELLDPICDYLTSKLIRYRYTQSDETYIQVNEEGKKGFMWVHCSSELSDCDPIVVFCYEATRGTDHLRRLFGEFLGYMTCDAYVSYQVMEKENPGMVVAGCLMHCRRYFAEAFFINDVASMTDEEIAGLPETKILLLIRDVYHEENKLSDMDASGRYAVRQEKVKPRMDELFDYIHELDDSDTVFSDRMEKAISYTINQEDKLKLFLTDGNIPCDNGRSERIIRSYSTGRVNWLFADTIVGAHINATIYSIVETAKANGVNVKVYLQYILEKMMARREDAKPFDDAFMETVMPWSSGYKEYEEHLIASSMAAMYRMFPEPLSPRTPHKVRDPVPISDNEPRNQIA